MTDQNAEPISLDLLTPAQLGWVLCDIAQTAKAVERLSILLNHCEDERDMETFILSIGNLAQRIGWAADMALERTTDNIGACCGGAEQWMMPPAFHDDATPPP